LAKKLTALEVERIKAPGTHRVDEGLYLQIKGGRSWLHRYMFAGKQRWSGLGSAADPKEGGLSLAKARAARDDERALIRQGVDPVAKRHRQRQDGAAAPAKKTFRDVADDYVANHEAAWKNTVHRAQWASTLRTYAFPILGEKPLEEITTDDVREVLQPIWHRKPETARRVRGRIEAILDLAKTLGLRGGDNPARWKGHLENVFPRRKKTAVKHHAAMPYSAIGGFMERLREREGVAALALEFTILTAARTGEVLGMRWDAGEIDLQGLMWEIPKERMKADKPHRVPLSKPAAAVLRKMAAINHSDFVFPLSNAAMLAVLDRMGHGDITVHGFRSSFKDWATDWTPTPAEIVEAAKRGEIVEAFPRDLVEVALAHTLDDKTEEAYRRTDMIEKRRRLMNRWAEHCSKVTAKGQIFQLSSAVENSPA
jgi:integrase